MRDAADGVIDPARLRLLNLVFGLAHLLQAVLFIVLSTAVDLDVTAMFVTARLADLRQRPRRVVADCGGWAHLRRARGRSFGDSMIVPVETGSSPSARSRRARHAFVTGS